MILLIGTENCSRCEMTKNILTNKNIEFEYKLLSELDNNEKQNYIAKAREKGIMSMPLIIKNNEIITLQEV